MARFGLVFDFRNPARWRLPWDTLYGQALDRIAYAEDLGFEYIWLTEHHFVDDGYAPSAMPIAAAVAARTHRVRIGTQVLLLPLYNAVRLAEDAATVDAISGGRLIFGAGLGYRAEEFEALGIPMRERLPRFLETLEVIRRAWEEPSLTFHGRFYDLDNVTVTPKPVQKPRPEIWIGASNEHGARRAAELGDGFLGVNKVHLIDVYRRRLAELKGPEAKPKVSKLAVMYVAEDPDRAWHELKDHFFYRHELYFQWLTEAGLTNPQYTPMGEITDADGLREADPTIICDVETCAELVEGYLDEEGITDLALFMELPGADHGRIVESMELFARKVMPRFK